MKYYIIFAFLLLFGMHADAQKYFTRSAHISFHSDAPLEKIEAHNKKVTAVMDTKSGRIEFAALIKAFHFEKALMEEHFNENYMESSTYPKATFKGQILDADQVDFSKDGTYDVTVEGDLTIHGITQPMKTKGQLNIANGMIGTRASFVIAVADYKIEIPSVVRDNIAKEVRIDVDGQLQALDKS